MTTLRRQVVGLATIIVLLVLAAVFGIAEKQNGTEMVDPVPITADTQPAAGSPELPRDLPDTDLLSALTAVCATNAAESADKEWTQEEIQSQIDAFNKLKLSLPERLSVSSSAEHLYLAALLEDSPVRRVELLDRAISSSPSDPFLIWGAVKICSESGYSADCPLRDWEQLLITVDGQNSESWIRVAANKYAAGEHAAALEAMRHASTAAESRAYWTETIEMTERGFAAGSDYAFAERASMAFGFAASELPRYGDYVRMCKEQSAQSVDWAYACLAYGELVENQGKTEMGVSIARSLQKLALEALGELEKAAEVEQRLQARRQERLDSIKDYNSATQRLVFSNPTLFSAFLAAIRSEGEEAAQRRIAAQIERLIERQPELACE